MDWLVKLITDFWFQLRAYLSNQIEYTYVFLTDLPLDILESFLNAISFIFNSLSIPNFLASNSLQTLFNTLDSSILYLLYHVGFFDGLAIYAAGVGFLLIRKIFTLGQW